MNSKSLKTLSIFTAFLFIISCALTVLGYTTSKKEKEPEVDPNSNETVIDRNITYKYYLEGQLVSEMPMNSIKEESNETNETNQTNETNETIEEEQKYKFDEYKCTNGVTGEFDLEKWKFIPNRSDTATCELYFNKAKYDVTLTIIKGKADENNNFSIERYKDGVFNIIPDDGYEFSEYQCSNDKTAEYDKSKNTFKISAISSDVTCKLTFTEKKLSFELTIKNGNCGEECVGGKIKKTLYYGEKTIFLVSPQNGYEFDEKKLNCNNNQTATYESGNLSITPTADTKCTLEFKKSIVVKHKISIRNSENADVKAKFSITQGSDEITVEDGGTGTMEILSNDVTILPKLDCPKQIPDFTDKGNSRVFTWMGVTKDITCDLIGEPKPTTVTE